MKINATIQRLRTYPAKLSIKKEAGMAALYHSNRHSDDLVTCLEICLPLPSLWGMKMEVAPSRPATT